MDKIYGFTDGVFQYPVVDAEKHRVSSFVNPRNRQPPGRMTSKSQFYRFQEPDRRAYDTQTGKHGTYIPFCVPPAVRAHVPYVPLRDVKDLTESDVIRRLNDYLQQLKRQAAARRAVAPLPLADASRMVAKRQHTP